jgi:phosphoribosylaminoimidazole-succinocarboxamide synthase
MAALQQTDFQFNCDFHKRRGKVRDIYTIEEFYMAFVATDRVSAFDAVMPQPIPYKGQVLNQLAQFFLNKSRDICKNHLLSVPHPNVSLGLKCEPFPVELIVRGYLCGHAWREYQAGNRTICGVELPEGLHENDPLPEPIITPSTKSLVGPDIDITEDEIMRSGLVPGDEYMQIKAMALELFKQGQAWADQCGLILADTKYEFGNKDFSIYLIDEIHTPDSSRYFIKEGFEERQRRGEPQEQFSKEYLRQWLIEQGFMGKDGQTPPDLPQEVIDEISKRYIQVYETMTGQPFEPMDSETPQEDIYEAIREELERLDIPA